MVCKNCGTQNNDTQKFCKSCGVGLTPPKQQTPAQRPSAQAKICPVCGCEIMPGSAKCEICGYTETQNAVVQQPVQLNIKNVDDGKAPITTIGQYMGWTILSCLPFVGFILTIIFAAIGSHKNRANFFRAILVWYLIAVLLLILAFVVSLIFGFSLFELMGGY